MEDVLLKGQPDQVDFIELDRVIEEEFHSEKENLIMILQAIQERYNFLPEEALRYLTSKLDMPLSRIYSVATFYATFSLEPKGRHIISVCTGTACHLKGGGRIAEEMSRQLGIQPGETTEDYGFTLETVNCLGACALAPVAVIDKKYQPKTDLGKLSKTVNTLRSE